MNENNNYDSGNVRPYKASGNLNTAIGNPSVNINDTMNMNIKSMNTSSVTSSNNQNYNGIMPNQNNVNYNGIMPNQNNVNYSTSGIIDTQTTSNAQSIYPNQTNQNNYAASVENKPNNQSNYANRTYVTPDNKSKKKAIKLDLGPEFKIALLIMVVLLVFIFLLPMIHDFISGR